MTKEELAKKKGVKLNKDSQTPSEALLTTNDKDSAVDKTLAPKNESKPETAEKESPASPMNIPVEEKAQEAPPSEKGVAPDPEGKNKGGRPKTKIGTYKIANISIPEADFNNMKEYALPLYKGNMTEYICTLIRKDLDANLKTYEMVNEAMKNAKGGA